MQKTNKTRHNRHILARSEVEDEKDDEAKDMADDEDPMEEDDRVPLA
jgi:hypothetical protein